MLIEDLRQCAQALNALATECYNRAKDKGFHDKPRTFGDAIALIHSEASEAFEAYREGTPFIEMFTTDGKPIGIPSELADIIIRVLDTCGEYEIPIGDVVLQKLQYNATRPHKHGGKII